MKQPREFEPTNGDSSGGTENTQDDLQKIKGIGKAVAQTLNQLGISRYSDLAGYNQEQLTELLRGKVPAITLQRLRLDDWIGQAKALADEQARQSASAASENGAAFDAYRESMQKGPRRGWREIADFFVSFGYSVDADGQEHLQTKVHHSQEDTLAEWDGIQTHQLIEWILSQANLPPERMSALPVERGEVDESWEVQSEEGVGLEIEDFWVSEVKEAAPAGRPAHGAGTALRAEGTLRLSGASVSEMTYEQPAFLVELYMVNIENNQSRLVSTYQNQLIPGSLAYDIRQDFPIPVAGHYQLHVVGRLLPPATGVIHLQGPLVHVEP